jgi:hypothetical protein
MDNNNGNDNDNDNGNDNGTAVMDPADFTQMMSSAHGILASVLPTMYTKPKYAVQGLIQVALETALQYKGDNFTVAEVIADLTKLMVHTCTTNGIGPHDKLSGPAMIAAINGPKATA